MRIKLFEEYKILSFDNYNIVSKYEHDKLIKNSNWLLLSIYELEKLEKYVKIKEMILSPFLPRPYYNLSYDKFFNIDLIKLEDDYYAINFYYRHDKYYIICDQFSELLKLIKYIKNNED